MLRIDTSSATTRVADDALWKRLKEIDARAAKIKTLAADFQQEKFTALLRKPLVSSGKVRIKGSLMRWDTSQPDPSILLIDEKEARIYYPAVKTLEVYPLDKRLGELAASPLPRLSVLAERFHFEQIPVKDLDPKVGPQRFIALRLVPKDVSLKQYVKQVRVLLDVSGAYVAKADMVDPDDERTVLTFRDVQRDEDVGDLELKLPAGVTITHPLEGLGDPAQRGEPRR